VEEYGELDKAKMIAAIERIQKRLGGLETKLTIQFLEEGKIEDAFRILLRYYDKWYWKGLHNRNNLEEICTAYKMDTVRAAENAARLLQPVKKIESSKNLMDEPGY
jgi:tRNA 2-selenouridine synthase